MTTEAKAHTTCRSTGWRARLEHNKLGGFVVNFRPVERSDSWPRFVSSRRVSDRDGRRLSLHDSYSLHHNSVKINAGETSVRRHRLALLHADFSGEYWAVITSIVQLAGGAVRFAGNLRALLCKVRSAADIGTLIVHRRPALTQTSCARCPEPEDLRDLSQNQGLVSVRCL